MSTEKWSQVWVSSSFESQMKKEIAKKKQKCLKRVLDDYKCNQSEQSDLDIVNNKSINNELNGCFIDLFVPTSSDELAFSRQKLNQLCDWFRKQFEQVTTNCQYESKFLLLNGPTGSGKTTSLKVLASQFNVQVLEYKAHNQHLERDLFDNNLIEINKNSVLSINQLESFKSFLWDSNHYSNSLDFESNDGVMSSSNSNRTSDRLQRLILIEEFPNLFYHKPESLHKELQLLEKRFGRRCVPIVFIISETINGQSDEYKLLPKSVQLDLGIKTITFKSISDTSLHKVLSKISDYQLSKDQIQKIVDCSSGDIRSAINNMQLKYMHLFDNKPKSASNNQTKSQKAKKIKSSIESDLESGGRDTSLTLNHAIGKILYAKRKDPETDTTSEDQQNSFKMPEHLSSNERIPLIENAENIAEKVVVSSDVLNAWLHENYLDFVDNISNAEQCIDWLSECDYMFSGQDLANKAICDSYQSSLAIRGLMFNLSTPNSRSSDSDSQQCSNKTNRKFKPFVKPQIFAVNRSLTSLKHQICQSMPELTHFSGIDSLVIDLMPFVSQMPNRLRETNSQFLSILNEVVDYDESQNRINVKELCNALSQSRVSHDFEQNSNSVRPFITELFCSSRQNETLMMTDSDNDDNYQIESDSD